MGHCQPFLRSWRTLKIDPLSIRERTMREERHTLSATSRDIDLFFELLIGLEELLILDRIVSHVSDVQGVCWRE